MQKFKQILIGLSAWSLLLGAPIAIANITSEESSSSADTASKTDTLEAEQAIGQSSLTKTPETYKPAESSGYYTEEESEAGTESEEDYGESTDAYEFNGAGCIKDQYVSGYMRSNGTYVNGYYRNSPSDNCQ